MTLGQFLATLDGSILIKVSDVAGDEIIKFYSKTNALDDALEARTIVKISITGATSIAVIVNNAE